MQDAQKALGVEAKLLESKAETDYVPNIKSFVDEKCDLIITVGFLLGDATKAAAEANPDIKFSIVDFAYDPAIPNVLGQVYRHRRGGVPRRLPRGRRLQDAAWSAPSAASTSRR